MLRTSTISTSRQAYTVSCLCPSLSRTPCPSPDAPRDPARDVAVAIPRLSCRSSLFARGMDLGRCRQPAEHRLICRCSIAGLRSGRLGKYLVGIGGEFITSTVCRLVFPATLALSGQKSLQWPAALSGAWGAPAIEVVSTARAEHLMGCPGDSW